jgi:hypothetical protein
MPAIGSKRCQALCTMEGSELRSELRSSGLSDFRQAPVATRGFVIPEPTWFGAFPLLYSLASAFVSQLPGVLVPS